ncbi:MAG: hypothetical protein QOG00_2171 [Pyrinomonadaceae bacterium]|nr:hypothetical protein [Pyrinomonadaceae bacterium]MDQ1590744.1 hypothetical protein [Pyrinomonadaceae bacterium]MDQ1612240.1 hypothetical protein [Pyrinomonadaceae bacterium]MDX6272738.1 hypothetical protein [Acidobacteriota bacterium]
MEESAIKAGRSVVYFIALLEKSAYFASPFALTQISRLTFDLLTVLYD